MEIRRKLTLAIIFSFLSGISIGSIPIALANNCDSVPTFHIFYLKEIKRCLEDNDNRIESRQDVLEEVTVFKLEEIENRIDSLERTVNGTITR